MESVAIACKTINGQSILFPNIHAVLFDLDGTLIDTLELHIKAFKWIIEKNGGRVSTDQLEPLLGMTPQDIIGKFLPHLSDKERWDLAIEKEEHLFELTDKINSYPGVVPFLKSLKKWGIKRVVISSTHRSLVNRLLNAAELTPFFDEMVSGDDVTRGKPYPEPFLKGLEKSGVSHKEAIAIGDSTHDIASAVAAGLNAIGVITGKTSAESLIREGAKCIIESFHALKVVDMV